MLLTLCFLIVGAAGCATGFTGDGIPPGRSTVIGRVVHADNSLLPVPNALVTVTTTVIGHGLAVTRSTTSYPVYSDDSGKFEITGIPTDKISSNVTVSVDPRSDKTLVPQKIVFPLANGRPTALIVALPSVTFPLAKIARIQLVQQSSTIVPVPTVQVKAQVLDANGADLGILPSLIFDGALAAITANGTIDVTANPDDQNPAPGNEIGVVTGTVDTHGSSNTQPSSTVGITRPTSGTTNSPVRTGAAKP